jgi:hypothetical protein
MHAKVNKDNSSFAEFETIFRTWRTPAAVPRARRPSQLSAEEVNMSIEGLFSPFRIKGLCADTDGPFIRLPLFLAKAGYHLSR